MGDEAERLFLFARRTVERSRQTLERLDPTAPDTSAYYDDLAEERHAQDEAEARMLERIAALSGGDE